MKHLIIACLAFALLAVPAGALADNGGGSAAPQRGAGRAGDGDKLKHLGQRIHDAVKECRKAKGDQRSACIQKAIAALEDIKSKINDLEAKIRSKCSSAGASTAVPKGCAKADKVIERLERLKSRIDAVETKLQSGKTAGHRVRTVPRTREEAAAQEQPGRRARISRVTVCHLEWWTPRRVTSSSPVRFELLRNRYAVVVRR